MKQTSIVMSLLLVMGLTVLYAADNDKVSEVRKVKAFSSVDITSVATVYFTQGDDYSLKIEGKEKLVKNISTIVTGNSLVIGFKEKNRNENYKRNDGVIIYLTAPDLKKVEFSGVGSFNCEGILKLDEVKFDVEGVGKLNIADLHCRVVRINLEGVGSVDARVNCDYLSANIEGVGRVKLHGSANRADISKGGIGSVNTTDLEIGK